MYTFITYISILLQAFNWYLLNNSGVFSFVNPIVDIDLIFRSAFYPTHPCMSLLDVRAHIT